MRMIQHVAATFLAVAAFALVGCTTAPVQSITDAPILAPGEQQLSLEEVSNAIVRAGASLGWRMKPVAPGHMVGVLHLRSHVAKVDVHYTTERYDITYKDSKNLDYTGETIHRAYNGWIQNLSDAIYNQIAML